MTEDKHIYAPAEGHGLAHDPFNAIVGPRPIGWVSTLSAEGVRNLAPYSFFNAFNYRPPIIGFCSTGAKNSLANVQATGEFVWNLATRALAEQMNVTAATVGPEVDEFELAGLIAAPSLRVKPSRVAASPVNFECRVTQILRLKTAAGDDVDSWVVFGEVVTAHIDRRFIKDGVYDTAAAHPVLRAGGPSTYVEVTPEAVFHMTRPR
ncbi:flavin reductase family protein [Caulobacter sp. S45]|uniref:flavin reductase family protein n=1 Tax=Caulobacter sp. S45 TaxID=1641861 RepID=UPI00131E310D|nr:flavin reductase family protein [Caulobacter sp. S45]